MRWSRHGIAREEVRSCFLYIARPSFLVLKSSCCTGSTDTAISNRRQYNSWALSESHSGRLSNHADGLQHWFKKWHELRKNKLTASTFSAAIGFWCQRRVQLWLEKLGLIEPFSGNLATCWNNIKEKEALESYEQITGYNVDLPEFQVYGNNNSEDG
ncbi:hypothetical protein NL676_026248 [Syzygium grande]|nr:hypothetical protein NL676_026248 [Syzygium grande]